MVRQEWLTGRVRHCKWQLLDGLRLYCRLSRGVVGQEGGAILFQQVRGVCVHACLAYMRPSIPLKKRKQQQNLRQPMSAVRIQYSTLCPHSYKRERHFLADIYIGRF